MTQPGFVRNLLLGMLSAAVLSLPLFALGQALPAPPDHPVPAAPAPDATGITPQGIMGVTPAQPPATGAPSALIAPTPPVAQAEPTGLRVGRRVSQMIGAKVTGAGERAVGEVEEIILPQGGGAPVAILSVGGFLGLNTHLVAVPVSRLLAPVSGQGLLLPDATPDNIRALPAFAYGE